MVTRLVPDPASAVPMTWAEGYPALLICATISLARCGAHATNSPPEVWGSVNRSRSQLAPSAGRGAPPPQLAQLRGGGPGADPSRGGGAARPPNGAPLARAPNPAPAPPGTPRPHRALAE